MSRASLEPKRKPHRCVNRDRVNRSDLGQLYRSQREELISAKTQLLESRPLAMIGTMAHFIFHDLRHHFCTIYCNAEFMSNQGTLPSDRQDLLADIRSSIDSMTEQLDSLLLFARTGCTLQLMRTSLNALVRDTANLIRNHPDARDVKISIQTAEPIEVWIDNKKLGSAVYNLLLNACQAAKRGGFPSLVEISLYHDHTSIFLRFTDNGPGVPDAVRGTLFQPFVTTEKVNGLGLGLTIAEHSAREHGGDVYLSESQPGRTVFVLCLSRTALAELAANRPALHAGDSSFRDIGHARQRRPAESLK